MKWIVRVGAALIAFAALAAGGLWLAGRGKGRGHVHRTVELARPASQVWPWISEPEKLREWQSGVLENQPIAEGGLRPGARLRRVMQRGRERVAMTVEITSVQPGRRLAATIHSEGPGFAMSEDYLLLERDGRSLLDYKGDFELEHWAAKAFTSAETAEAQRKLDADFVALQRLVESQPPARATPALAAEPNLAVQPAPALPGAAGQPALAAQPGAAAPDSQPAPTPPNARPSSATAR
jgi:uncharacterized protein YndB with AHSA1/START domain